MVSALVEACHGIAWSGAPGRDNEKMSQSSHGSSRSSWFMMFQYVSCFDVMCHSVLFQFICGQHGIALDIA